MKKRAKKYTESGITSHLAASFVSSLVSWLLSHLITRSHISRLTLSWHKAQVCWAQKTRAWNVQFGLVNSSQGFFDQFQSTSAEGWEEGKRPSRPWANNTPLVPNQPDEEGLIIDPCCKTQAEMALVNSLKHKTSINNLLGGSRRCEVQSDCLQQTLGHEVAFGITHLGKDIFLFLFFPFLNYYVTDVCSSWKT